MSVARLYIDGRPWEIMGNVTDSFTGYTNEVMVSRGGRLYPVTEPKVKTLSVDDVMVDNDEFDEVAKFIDECATRRFVATIEFLPDCGDITGGLASGREYHYVECFFQGEPEYSLTERKISDFQLAYTRRVER